MWRLHMLLMPAYIVIGFVWGVLYAIALIPLHLTGRTPASVRANIRRLREKELRYAERLGAGLPHRLQALGVRRMARPTNADDEPVEDNSAR